MQISLYFMSMGVHRKEVKLKEVVRIRGLDTILTKERGFEHQGTINCGKVTKKYLHVGSNGGEELF